MTIGAVNAVFRANLESPGAKFVLVALADHASTKDGEEWVAYPSIARMVAFTSYSDSTVRLHLKWLQGDAEREAWIIQRPRKDRKRGSSAYEYVLNKELIENSVDPYFIRAPPKSGGDDNSPPPDFGTKTAGIRDGDRRISASPIEERLIEPPPEPSAGGQDEDFEAVFKLWIDRLPTQTSRPKCEEAWREALSMASGAGLRFAAERYLREDPDVRRQGPKWLHKWLEDEYWRNLLPPAGPAQTSVIATFDGPAEVRAAVVAAQGEDFTASYLDPCSWSWEPRAIVPRFQIAYDKLTRAVGRELTALGVAIVLPSRGAA